MAGRHGAVPAMRVGLRLLAAAAAVVATFTLVGLLITKVLANTGLQRADARADVVLARDRTPAWNAVTHYVTLLAETTTVVVVGLVVFLLLGLLLRRWRESVFLAVALVGEVTIFVATTLLVHRHRPPVPHLDPAPPTSSFPSGHTAASVALYGGLALIASRTVRQAAVRAVVVVLGVVVPLAVALSRIYRGMHFPTDVLAGGLLAAAWLAVIAPVLLPGRPPRTSGPISR